MSETAKANAAEADWVSVCAEDDLSTNSGICALVEGRQVAIFLESRTQHLYALSNHDPIAGANVMSRGIIGSIQGQPVVASPLYKQHFDLNTGACVELPEHRLAVYNVRLHGGEVQVWSSPREG